ncbi:hypothetical protein M5689_019155 [Euphorbia peplus]|nr:hypothetical protein M5689_019155 [Euphorbia peplus]
MKVNFSLSWQGKLLESSVTAILRIAFEILSREVQKSAVRASKDGGSSGKSLSLKFKLSSSSFESCLILSGIFSKLFSVKVSLHNEDKQKKWCKIFDALM